MGMIGKEKDKEEKDRQEAIIKAFTRDFVNQLFEIGSRENLPENLTFKGVNCVRTFASGEAVGFNIIFNKAK